MLAVMVYCANLWPGWALSSATLVTYLIGGGSAPAIAVLGLLVIGASLTLAPVVYVALERMIFIKVAAVAGTMMCFYSVLLIVINRRHLPQAIRIRSYRLAIMVWATLVFGALAALTIRQQLSMLLNGGVQ